MGSPPQPVVIGYYRWTDIFYQWHQAVSIDPVVQSAVKAFLKPQSLTHVDHPLRSGNPEGIELWMGTFTNGLGKLLFSAAQVEYTRYWLLEMGFSKGAVLPIPNSSYLLTLGRDLRAVSPVIYSTAKDIKDANKAIDKANKRLKGPAEKLLDLRIAFERVRNCWRNKLGTWCAIDFETWEMEHDLVTEVGLSLISWDKDQEKLEDRHLIVKEHKMYTNSKYVRGNRDNFLFGKSEELGLKVVQQIMSDLFVDWQQKGPLFLIFHSKAEDVKILRTWKLPMEGYTTGIPDMLPSTGVFAIDTVELFGALVGDPKIQRTLERVCRMLELDEPLDCFHNAGNDSHYTLMACRSMAIGPPVDMQRENRWPGQSGATIKVDWRPWQDDSDMSDTEGVMAKGAQSHGNESEEEIHE